MKILGVDTTRKCASIYIIGDDDYTVYSLGENEKQSEFLMLSLDKFLQENNCQLSDFDCFGVIVGPGSFTGIRVGIATIKAFAYALNKKIVSSTVFDIVKDDIKNGIFLTECTSTTCYYADIVKGKIAKCGVIDKDDIVGFNKELFILEDEHNLRSMAYKFNVLNNYSNLCSNKLLQLANKANFTSPEPYYVQLSQAERNLEKKND